MKTMEMVDHISLRNIYTPNNIGSLEWTFQYYYHATPGEPLQGSPGVAW